MMLLSNKIMPSFNEPSRVDRPNKSELQGCVIDEYKVQLSRNNISSRMVKSGHLILKAHAYHTNE